MKQETIDRIRKFTDDRDWEQFHSAANLAKSIVIEAAELLECFQWNDEEYDLQHVKEELADVIVTPGTEFGPQYVHPFRINFSQDKEKAAAAMKRLFAVMERYRKQ